VAEESQLPKSSPPVGMYPSRLDDKGRIMVIATHNCDNGDSWEREGEDDFFFHEFSEKRGYPLGINIVFYIMTH